jgi:hypothetical protein
MEGTHRKVSVYGLLTILIGPQIRVDVPMATNTPALLILITSVVVPKSLAISDRAGKIEVLENVAAKVIQLVTERMTTFRHVGKFMNGRVSSSVVVGVVVPDDGAAVTSVFSSSGTARTDMA